jgi:hypothetical protein
MHAATKQYVDSEIAALRNSLAAQEFQARINSLLGLGSVGNYAYDSGYGSLSATGSKFGNGTWEWTGNGITNVGGRHTCSTSSSSPNNGNGPNCWCQRMQVGSYVSTGSWVFLYGYTSASSCSTGCAYDCSRCARNVSSSSCSRSALLAL